MLSGPLSSVPRVLCVCAVRVQWNRFQTPGTRRWCLIAAAASASILCVCVILWCSRTFRKRFLEPVEYNFGPNPHQIPHSFVQSLWFCAYTRTHGTQTHTHTQGMRLLCTNRSTSDRFCRTANARSENGETFTAQTFLCGQMHTVDYVVHIVCTCTWNMRLWCERCVPNEINYLSKDRW